MNEQDFIALFPYAKIHEKLTAKQACILLPLSSGRWLEVDSSQLSAKQEDALRAYYQHERVNRWEHQFWYRCMVLEKENIQMDCDKIQFIHLHVYQDHTIQPEILEVFQAFFPNLLSSFFTSKQHIIFVLDQTILVELHQALHDIVVTVELDFGVKLVVFIGHIWAVQQVMLPKLFQKEHHLFEQWVSEYQRSMCLAFSQLMLWNQRNAQQDVTVITNCLKQLIQKHEQLDSIIMMLWQEMAVLTKTAQKLYMHRNTLQYKLDKFYEQTGLTLKRMDDLALCYFVLLDNSF